MIERSNNLFIDIKTIRLWFLSRYFPMGLDKGLEKVFNKDMSVTLLLKQMGLGNMFGDRSKGRLSPMVKERQRFESEVRRQFVELKKKGISIPVFTL